MSKNSAEIKAAPRRWFRFYAESIDDPKVQKLPPHLFKTWVNLLSLACMNNGALPRRDDIPFKLRMSDHDAQSQLDELISAGLIDIGPGGALEPHNWKARQYVSDTSNERVRKHRTKKKETECNGERNVTRNEDATPPEADTDSDTEQIQTSPLPPPGNSDDQAEPVVLKNGELTLSNRLWCTWLEIFGGDKIRLLLALREIAGRIQPNGQRPLEAQVSSQLARIAGDKHDRAKNYASAVERNRQAEQSRKKFDWSQIEIVDREPSRHVGV